MGKIAIVLMFLMGSVSYGQSLTLYESFDGFYGPINNGQDWGITRPGWFEKNRSSPLGDVGFFNGNHSQFPPKFGSGYLGSNRLSVGPIFPPDTGTISNWIFTPVININNTTTITFWTRTGQEFYNGDFPDRLQVRLSFSGESTYVGNDENSVGDFTVLLKDINPDYTSTGYPLQWEMQTINVAKHYIPTVKRATGRIAFRYFCKNVKSGGVFYPPGEGGNGFYIGIDELKIYGYGG